MAETTKLVIAIIIALIVGIGIGYAAGMGAVQTVTTTTTVTVTTPVTTPSPSPVGPPVTLTVVGPWSGGEMEAFMEVLKAFEEQTGIKIEYRIYRAEDLASVAPPQFEAGMAPGDVLITPWGWWIAEMGKKGHLIDLAGLVDENEYVTGIFDPVKADGKVYGLPFTAWAKPGFWYRKSFFEQHGLKPPETWDEFVSLLSELKGILGGPPIVTGDGVGWPVGDVAEHFIIAFGGPELQLKLINGEVKFTDPEVKSIFEEKLVPLLKEGYFSEPIEWTRAVELWWKGDYALYFMGTWITGMVEDPDDLGIFPIPGTKGVVMGTDYICIPKYTKHLEEAKMLAKFLATEGQRIHVGTKAGKFATWLKVGIEDHWAPMQGVYRFVKEMQPVPDLDDAVGGKWQTLFWDQMKLLWVEPDRLDEILTTLDENFPSE